MARTEAKHEAISLKESPEARGDITGMIGMIGNKVKGSLSITFTQSVALDICSKMLGEKFTEVDDSVVDLVGEITNMVTGGAKRILADQGHDFNMATPNVITGLNHRIHHQCQGQIIQIPFKAESGKFYVEVSFEDVK